MYVLLLSCSYNVLEHTADPASGEELWRPGGSCQLESLPGALAASTAHTLRLSGCWFPITTQLPAARRELRVSTDIPQPTRSPADALISGVGEACFIFLGGVLAQGVEELNVRRGIGCEIRREIR